MPFTCSICAMVLKQENRMYTDQHTRSRRHIIMMDNNVEYTNYRSTISKPRPIVIYDKPTTDFQNPCKKCGVTDSRRFYPYYKSYCKTCKYDNEKHKKSLYNNVL